MFGKLGGSLRTKLTLVVAVILVAGCLSLWYVAEDRAGKALEAEAEEAIFKVARQTAETTNWLVTSRINVVEGLAGNSIIRGQWGDRESTREEKLAVLRSEQKRVESQGFKQLGFADREGNLVLSDGSTANIADRDYFRAALGGKTTVSTTLVSKADNSLIFVYASPVRHYATDQVYGVVIGVIDASRLSALISNVTYARTGYAFAVDSTGKIIAHKDLEKVKAQENYLEQAKSNPSLASLAAVISKMIAGEEGIGRYTFEGEEKICAYAPVKASGWSVAVTAPKSEVLARAAGVRSGVLTISVIVIAVALLLVLFLMRNLTAGIAAAASHLGVIAEGDFTRPVGEKHLPLKDEIGQMARAVDKMQNSMRALLSGIKEDAKALAQSSEA
ncbi:MAG: HAMP domain-containing protein, partial [Moorellales bacterium]